jgi:homoserine O-acetyltransferase
MGAQQVYEWTVRFPESVARAAAIAGMARNSEHGFLLAQTLADSITSDPGYAAGYYRSPTEVADGLERHAKLWTVMGWSSDFFRERRHQALGFEDLHNFVQRFMVPYFAPMDPNDLLCMIWKWQRGDVGRQMDGDLSAALGRIRAKTLVMPISHDMVFPPAGCAAEQSHIAGSEFRVLESIDGHLGLFGTDAKMLAQLDSHLRDLLASPAH